MRLVRSSNTKPEIAVRRLVWSLGWRYRLNVRTLPGQPDLVLSRLKKVIFVHGCFWHSHEGCKRATMPKTRTEFWTAKLLYNKGRDARNAAKLQELGWDVLVIWECSLKNPSLVTETIATFLNGNGHDVRAASTSNKP